MKVRLLAVMAVVVVGVMAGTSPAMAKKAHTASEWSHQHADNKAFGEAIHKLRISNDLTNYSVGQITAASIVALTALKDGLTKVADATTEFKYGVVQVGLATGGAGDGIVGFGPTEFYVTPPIYKTGEQSQVTFPIGKSAAPLATRLFTAVRSVYPDKGAVECRVSIVGQTLANAASAVTGTLPDPAIGAYTGSAAAQVITATAVKKATASNGAGGFFHKMPQSRIQPENGNSTYPLALVALEDNAINLAGSELLGGTSFIATTSATAVLSCIRTS